MQVQYFLCRLKTKWFVHSLSFQAAMNLYKQFSKNPYYFWAVMSIVMQVPTNNFFVQFVLFVIQYRWQE